VGSLQADALSHLHLRTGAIDEGLERQDVPGRTLEEHGHAAAQLLDPPTQGPHEVGPNRESGPRRRGGKSR
jgi:hypothetical protein